MFGLGKKKKVDGRTVLLLDIESGSVGAALVRLSAAQQPRMFGARRAQVPVEHTRTGAGLVQSIGQVLKKTLYEIAEAATRLRFHPKTAAMGTVSGVSVIMASPWGTPNLEAGQPDFLEEVVSSTNVGVRTSFGDIPLSLYTSAGAAAYGARTLFGQEPALLCTVGGEVTELIALDEHGVAAHATAPLGSNALLRTLRAHGGYSFAEARSAARLPFDTPHLQAPFRSSGEHFASQFADAAREFAAPGQYSRIRVIAGEPAGEWYARALSTSQALGTLFPHGEVRTLRPHHLYPFVVAHVSPPDIPLLLGALFIDSQPM
ncbi:hypothetical protein A3D70_02475 [Candidatus Adlerbacteria bacterium RIFCSPHIGHO2_02_FULL_54_18]|uniref:SHS2 domain-containing protein n=2 Tax=Candidatus Adleribacteriota TaxID=1752736 RepID=A0A1F4Y1H5_9BACT|nr:MAG: hypothetical protein A2949_01835 [Candidatus Adlerbacteria bacterium RIFCSPLOWO2_01_FULL_54_21b]OGC87830.1 MAG: hypothetical protein A3D70_02475 [Candidatus Adlerbacteria bacterium RIFCSPHIGHO2_02_FULL_54_18]